jgi:dCMP deaminase
MVGSIEKLTHAWVLERLSHRSNCVRRQIAASIVSQDGRLLSTGWNHAMPLEEKCDTSCPRALSTIPAGGYDGFESFEAYKAAAGECIAIHAEDAALRKTTLEERKGGVMYITAEPCGDCEKLLQDSGLARWEVVK